MYCPNCKQEYDGNFCPECGTKLIEKPADSGVSVNLGDANAISGGLHVADSHNVHNEDRSVHNITNTTSTVNNITQVSARKTEMELLQERKTLYLNACKRAYEDNVLEQWEKMELDRYRMEIGLDEATADRILDQVRQLVNRNAPKNELTGLAKIKLKQLTDALKNNEVQAIMRQIDSFEALAGKFTNDELQYKYYLVLATLRHEKCIEKYENSKVDNYWKSFWTYLAYLKADNMAKAAEILYSLDDKFPNYPEDNITLLATAGSYIKNDIEAAKDYLDTVSGDYSPALQRFAETVYFLLDPELAKEMGATEQSCAFYLVNIFKQGTGTHNLVSEQTTSKETENTQVSERKQTKQETTIETTTKSAVSESSSDVILKKEKLERAKVSEIAKQKEEKDKQEIKQLRDKLNNLAGKWEKEGSPMLEAIPQLCEEYLKKLESSLIEDNHNCRFWQTPLYKRYEWDSIEKCVSLHRKLVELNFDSVKKDISRLDNISKKIIESLEIMESGKDNKSYETQLKSVNDQLKKYESCINQLIDDVPHSLLRFYKRMNRFKTGGNIVVSGRPEPYLGKDSALKYCLSE